MPKEVIVLNTHSFVDVITNSSTELFVCDTDKTLKEVRSILTDIVKPLGYTYHACFKDPYKYTKEHFMEDTRGENSDWLYGYEKRKNIGKIIIEGECDNSIPYEAFDMIDRIFKAKHYHLG